MTVIDEIPPAHRIRIDMLFWKHRSPFAGTQEQLDELKADTHRRAGARFHAELTGYIQQTQPAPHPSIHDHHHPATRRLKPIVHVGLVPMLWAITTCACGERWPCHKIKQHLRAKFGWTTDITHELTTITRQLPRPRTTFTRLRRLLHRVRQPRTAMAPTMTPTPPHNPSHDPAHPTRRLEPTTHQHTHPPHPARPRAGGPGTDNPKTRPGMMGTAPHNRGKPRNHSTP